VVDVGADENVRLHLASNSGGSHTADFFVGRDGVKDADVFERLFGKKAGEFGDHEAAESVVEIGPVEGVFGEPLADGAVENDGVTRTDAEFLDALLAIIAVHLEFEKKHLRFDSLGARALGGFGEMNGAHGFDRASFDHTVVAGFIRLL